MSPAAESYRPVVLLVVAVVALVALWAIRDVAMLAAFALLTAYALDPLVVMVERLPLPRGRRLPRSIAAGLVMTALVALVSWLAIVTAPRLGAELGGFIHRIPAGVDIVASEGRRLAGEWGMSTYVDPAFAALRDNSGALVQKAGAVIAGWVGRLFGGLGQLLGLAILPLLAFYLLAEREAVQASMLRFVPEEAHGRMVEAIGHVDRALKSYVRGQALVCVLVGTTVAAALTMLGVPLALLLGVVAGIAEVVPFLGAFVTTVMIALVGLGGGAHLAAFGVGAYLIINNGIGALVTPRVMGRHLMMHPFVVTVSILAGASLLGPPGAMLALPGAAVAQSLMQAFTRPRERPSEPAPPAP